MKAIIMAGGEGRRLRPLTCTMPKPMARVMNKPVMEHIINLLKKHNITEIGVTLMYMPEVIKEYFGNGSDFGVSITYFTEETPLGTAGSVKNAGDFIDGDFLVISGDALCDINLTELIDFHYQKKADATLCLTPMEIPIEYGVVVTNNDGRVVRFLEKPAWSQVFSDTVNTGIYVLSPDVLNFADCLPADFSKDIFPGMLSENRPIYGYVTDGYWCDIGDINAYRHCHFDIMDKKLDGVGFTQVGDNVTIEDGAVINQPVFIGSGSRIKSGAVIDAYTVIGENVTVCRDTSIKRSVIYDGCMIGKGVQIRGAVLCENCTVREGSSIFEQAVVGAGCTLGEQVVIKPSVKIWPDKQVEAGSVQKDNMVWGSSRCRGLFGERGLCGEVNVDITPELAGKLGAAIGSVNNREKTGISCDGTAAAEMLKNSVKSGLLSAGAQVYDFGNQPLPVTRAGICMYRLRNGVHISSDGDGKCYVDVLDEYGANLSASSVKKIENAVSCEQFKRAEPGAIGEVTSLCEYKLYYLRELINPVAKAQTKTRVLFACPSEQGGKLIVNIADELGWDVRVIKDEISAKDSVALKHFSETLTEEECVMGVVMDRVCEQIILFDERGRYIDRDKYKALAALIVMKKHENTAIAVTVSAPSVIDEMARHYGAHIIRTKESPLELMGALCTDEAKEELHEQFVLHFDAVGAVVKIIDFMQTQNITLAALVDEIPQFYTVRREAECRFGDKGRVIRRIISETDDSKVKTLDGVDIAEKKGRVVIIPDRIKPVCTLVCEAASEEYAEELADIYIEKIRLQKE